MAKTKLAEKRAVLVFMDDAGKPHKLTPDDTVVWRIAGYALMPQHNLMLMIKPPQKKYWELPGGCIEPVESVDEGVARLVFAQTGYRVRRARDMQPVSVGEWNFYDSVSKKFCHCIYLIIMVEWNSADNAMMVETIDACPMKLFYPGEGDRVNTSPIALQGLKVWTQRFVCT